MDDFTLYLDILQKTYCKEAGEMENLDIQIPETKRILRMMDGEQIELKPSGRSIRKIMDFALQFDVVEAENRQWDLNLN